MHMLETIIRTATNEIIKPTIFAKRTPLPSLRIAQMHNAIPVAKAIKPNAIVIPVNIMVSLPQNYDPLAIQCTLYAMHCQYQIQKTEAMFFQKKLSYSEMLYYAVKVEHKRRTL